MGKEAKYVVRLSEEERTRLGELVARGRVAASVRQRALILLQADVEGPAWTDEQIAELIQVGLSTVHRARQRCVEEGLDAALQRKPSPQRQYRKLDGVQEARRRAVWAGCRTMDGRYVDGSKSVAWTPRTSCSGMSAGGSTDTGAPLESASTSATPRARRSPLLSSPTSHSAAALICGEREMARSCGSRRFPCSLPGNRCGRFCRGRKLADHSRFPQRNPCLSLSGRADCRRAPRSSEV